MNYRGKRFLDICLSIILLSLTFPIILVFAIILFFIHGNPFFIQERSGIYGKKIRIIKLRTVKFVNNHPKINFICHFLRLSKIDELPQLINVLKNDISIVGPRPLYLEYNNFLKSHHKKRLMIKPGITGYSQINLKDPNDWSKKFDYDTYYVENLSLKLDLLIIIKSIVLIFKILFSNNEIKIIDEKKDFYQQYLKSK